LELSENENQDEAKEILIELAKLCWEEKPEQRPSFAQIHQKLDPLVQI